MNHFIKLALILFVSANLQAQEPAPMLLSPDQAVELAIKNNLGLESSRTNLATKRRADSLSWNQFIPNITASGTLNRDNEASSPTIVSFPIPTLGASGTPFTHNGFSGTIYPSSSFFMSDPIDIPQWRVIGNIQASVNISLVMFENMNRLRLDYETGLLEFDRAKKQLERDVRKAYHNMLLLQENINLMRGSFENMERQVQMARANFNAGLVPELTLLQAQVARENMRPVIDQVENGLKLSMAQFAMFLGMDYDVQFELIPISENTSSLDSDFISFDVADLISKAAAGKPDIQELRRTIMMLESTRKMQVYALYPSLNLSWNTNQIFTRDPWKDSWFKSNHWTDRGSLSITLALRLHSLFPFSTDTQGIRNIEDQIRMATIGLAQMVVGTEIEIYNIILTLERTRTNAHAHAQTVELAERSYRLTEQAYRAGLQDYFQVQNAEQSLHQARVQLLEQQFNYLNGLIDLEYSIGVPFGTLSERRR
ncbi:MAG: TolC family protein [Treponema sp.]|jgi:outer membrane protein TolC|nr:TolC family protein [Treponema sp.]